MCDPLAPVRHVLTEAKENRRVCAIFILLLVGVPSVGISALVYFANQWTWYQANPLQTLKETTIRQFPRTKLIVVPQQYFYNDTPENIDTYYFPTEPFATNWSKPLPIPTPGPSENETVEARVNRTWVFYNSSWYRCRFEQSRAFVVAVQIDWRERISNQVKGFRKPFSVDVIVGEASYPFSHVSDEYGNVQSHLLADANAKCWMLSSPRYENPWTEVGSGSEPIECSFEKDIPCDHGGGYEDSIPVAALLNLQWTSTIGLMPSKPFQEGDRVNFADAFWTRDYLLPWNRGSSSWSLIPWAAEEPFEPIADLFKKKEAVASFWSFTSLMTMRFINLQRRFPQGVTFRMNEDAVLSLKSQLIVNTSRSWTLSPITKSQCIISAQRTSNRMMTGDGAKNPSLIDLRGLSLVPDFTQQEKNFNIQYTWINVFSSTWPIVSFALGIFYFFFPGTVKVPLHFRDAQKSKEMTRLLGFPDEGARTPDNVSGTSMPNVEALLPC